MTVESSRPCYLCDKLTFYKTKLGATVCRPCQMRFFDRDPIEVAERRARVAARKEKITKQRAERKKSKKKVETIVPRIQDKGTEQTAEDETDDWAEADTLPYGMFPYGWVPDDKG